MDNKSNIQFLCNQLKNLKKSKALAKKNLKSKKENTLGGSNMTSVRDIQSRDTSRQELKNLVASVKRKASTFNGMGESNNIKNKKMKVKTETGNTISEAKTKSTSDKKKKKKKKKESQLTT